MRALVDALHDAALAFLDAITAPIRAIRVLAGALAFVAMIAVAPRILDVSGRAIDRILGTVTRR